MLRTGPQVLRTNRFTFTIIARIIIAQNPYALLEDFFCGGSLLLFGFVGDQSRSLRGPASSSVVKRMGFTV